MKFTDPRYIFGMALLMVIMSIAMIIALGSVKQESSYGLEIVLGMLGPLTGGFAQWAFSQAAKTKSDDSQVPPIK